jgi:hypothetical protein
MATVTTSSQSQIDPTIQPYLAQGLETARNLFLGGFQPQLYPGQMYVSPSEQTLAGLAQQEQLATQASPVLQQAQGAYTSALGGLGQTASGSFLNANPYQQQMMEAATRPLQQQFSNQVLPGIASLYSKSGRYGSGAMANALSQSSEAYGRAMGDITGTLAGQQYQAERGLQQQAQAAQAQLAAQAPSMYAQQFLPSQTLMDVGAQREAIAAQPLQEQMQRFSYSQQLPYQQLAGYLSSVYGSPMANYGTQTQTQNMPTNKTVGVLGGAGLGGLLGYGLSQAAPSVFGGMGGYAAPVLGAVGGGLLGGLF